MQPAGVAGGNHRPRHWEKRVAAAYFRMMGYTQAATGTTVGRSERTIQDWEADKLTWAQAREDARQRWLGELTDTARVTLLTTLQEGPHGFLALQVLERLDSALAPAKHQLDVSVEGGGLAALLLRHREDAHADDQPAVARGPRRIS
jgi:hypothetical protein